ncbi:MAG: MFS transporter [Firmicutes bacterium HGW-Firmicutes-14]|nr:MAG: MFS transporter [Firmicutes bacterium HGW-Firmicutes-14]
MTKNKVQYGIVLIIAGAHLVNDAYSNFLPQYLPFLISNTGISFAKAGFLVSVFTFSSSIMQPLLGYIIDKQGKNWFVSLGTFWMTVFLSLIGLTDNYLALVLLAALSGMGIAVFHPQASFLTSEASGERKGLMMSIFMATGNLGFALSPVIFVPMLNITGSAGTLYLLIPGILVSLVLLKTVGKAEIVKQETPVIKKSLLKTLIGSGKEMIKLVAVIVIRTAAYFGLIVLLPNYFKAAGLSVITASYLVFYMLFAGVLGSLLGGWISDWAGKKPVTVISLFLSSFTYFGFFYTEGIISYILLACAGGLLWGSFSVTVVMAQELIPDNKALAGGISMGLAIGVGGLVVSLVGLFADVYGLTAAVKLLFVFPALAGTVALSMQKKF